MYSVMQALAWLAGSGKICEDLSVFRDANSAITKRDNKEDRKDTKIYTHYVTITCQQQFARQAFSFELRPLAGPALQFSRKKTGLNKHPCDGL